MSDTHIYIASAIISGVLELIIRGGPPFCRWLCRTLNIAE